MKPEISVPGRRVVGRVVLTSQGFSLSDSVLAMIRKLLRGAPVELAGLFVEDARLLLAASLPLTREVGRESAIVRTFDATDMERLMQHRAQSFQTQLAELAREMALPWTFETHRGDFTAHTMHALEKANLVVVGAGESSPVPSRESRTRSAREAESVIAVMDTGPTGMEVLRTASDLVHENDATLNVFVVTQSAEDFETTRRQIRLVAGTGFIRFIEPSADIPASIRSPELQTRKRDLLVLSAKLLTDQAAELVSRWAGRLILVSGTH